MNIVAITGMTPIEIDSAPASARGRSIASAIATAAISPTRIRQESGAAARIRSTAETASTPADVVRPLTRTIPRMETATKSGFFQRKCAR